MPKFLVGLSAFLLLLVMCVSGYGQGRNSFVIQEQGTASVTGTSASFIDADKKRNYMILQNLGSSAVFIKFGSVHTDEEGVKIDPGGYYEPFMVPREAVYGKSESGTNVINYMTGR